MSEPEVHHKKAFLFHHIAAFPWPFLVVLPAVFIVLIALGWSQDDIVEQDVASIWIPTDNQYAKDMRYAEEVIGADPNPQSSVAAMANSFDFTNLLVPERLEEIRQRMVEIEGVQVEYNGVTFIYDDVCSASSAPYSLPCLRLSPMDFFQEANWYFNDFERVVWYQAVVQDLLLRPRVPRFSSLTGPACSTQADGSPSASTVCDSVIQYRFATGNPLGLFADIGDLELSDPCRICYDQVYEQTIEQLYSLTVGSFSVLTAELQRALQGKDWTEDPAGQAALVSLLAKSSQLMSVTEEEVDEFYYYYVVRGLYAQLGAASYISGYEQFAPLISQCVPQAGMVCPSPNVTLAEAMSALEQHADNVFSSVTTAGIPYPFWSSGDGTGFLFGGSEPVSGSGVDMSGRLDGMAGYLDIQNYGQAGWTPLYGTADGFIDPDPQNPVWVALMETNPVYAWFMADLTEADHLCGNGVLTGTNTGIPALDQTTAFVMAQASTEWCTRYDFPNEQAPLPGPFTKQHFARMWYDLLMASPSFLNIQQGTDDPYTWTTGNGCGYSLGGARSIYTNESLADLQLSASGVLYNIDEGANVGPTDRNILMGGTTPDLGDFSVENPVQEIKVLQTIYSLAMPRDMVNRVKLCNRPDGPVEITESDATEILRLMKVEMEDTWSAGWNNPSSGDIQFSIFIDDDGSDGTFARALEEYTLDNTLLTIISMVVIAVFTAVFMFSVDLVESQVFLSLIGVGLVILAYFAAIGFMLLIGTKINIGMAQTLPFIMIGLGVNDIYIILQALKQQGGYGEHHYLKAMKEVIVPVTMTSIVNASMFSVLNISDIPAIYLTAQSALCSVIALYLVAIFCYPAYCYLDMKRQASGRLDLLFCVKGEVPDENVRVEDVRSKILFKNFYEPLMLADGPVRYVVHLLVWMGGIALFALGVYGITERDIGLGVAEFFQDEHQASVWATVRARELASWPVTMNWGAIDYTDPDIQMRMVKQYEDYVGLARIAQIDTNQLWMADFLLWTSRMCDDNFDRSDFASLECGRDQYHNATDSYCAGSWAENKFDLQLKVFSSPTDQTCEPYSGGICRPFSEMHIADIAEFSLEADKEYCPVVDDWTDEKWQFCLVRWREITGFSGGNFVLEDDGTPTGCPGVTQNDQSFVWPIPYSSGPTSMFAYDMGTHDDTLDLILNTKEVCNNENGMHCWVSGVPYDYWSQYDGIFKVLVELCGYSVLVGSCIAFIFLYGKLTSENLYPQSKVIVGSLIGAALIAVVILVSTVAVTGLSILSDVTLTGFSNMSFVLSVGFAVEYAVHIVSRWLRAPESARTGVERVRFTMSFLMVPTFMSFVSSTIGVVCLGFSDFQFTEVYFFRPLIIIMCVTWFFGVWWLPSLLTMLSFEAVRLPSGEDDFDTESHHLQPEEKAPEDGPKEENGASKDDEGSVVT